MWSSPPCRSAFLVLLAGTLTLTGCGSQGPSPDGPLRLVEPVDPVAPSVLPPVHQGLLDASDAYRDEEGWWIVDRRTAEVHRLDGELRSLHRFGGRGDAPGEMVRPSSLARRADTLVVLDEQDVPVLHLFRPDGTFIRRELIRADGCNTLLGTGLIDRPGHAPLLLATCSRLLPRPSVGSVVILLADDWSGQVVAGSLVPMRPGSLRPESAIGAIHDGVLWAGTSSEPCLDGFALPDGAAPPAVERRCMDPWIGVRFNVREAMAQTMNRPIPDIFDDVGWLPAADRVFSHPEGIVFRRMSGMHARELVLVDRAGALHPLAQQLPEASWVWGDELLVAWASIEGVHLERRSIREARSERRIEAQGAGSR